MSKRKQIEQLGLKDPVVWMGLELHRRGELSWESMLETVVQVLAKQNDLNRKALMDQEHRLSVDVATANATIERLIEERDEARKELEELGADLGNLNSIRQLLWEQGECDPGADELDQVRQLCERLRAAERERDRLGAELKEALERDEAQAGAEAADHTCDACGQTWTCPLGDLLTAAERERDEARAQLATASDPTRYMQPAQELYRLAGAAENETLVDAIKRLVSDRDEARRQAEVTRIARDDALRERDEWRDATGLASLSVEQAAARLRCLADERLGALARAEKAEAEIKRLQEELESRCDSEHRCDQHGWLGHNAIVCACCVEEDVEALRLDVERFASDGLEKIAPRDGQVASDIRYEAHASLGAIRERVVGSGRGARRAGRRLGESDPVTGAQRIAAERARHMETWSAKHDDEHDRGEMAIAAAALAVEHTDAIVEDRGDGDLDSLADGWGLLKKHRGDTIRCLEIAGALIAAEIDRISRKEVAGECSPTKT